ncbi:hypothetical protein F0562_006894 [Nyssa sinensis]|uniref:C3H1-type domain-containing protein n=1 Tax=Nyssa sinensis TaxID=561372 RepID=A0A5J5ANT4_9ASTE|nr:hypothetical protein F0562_006894 [Nyssa sinensis]
MKRLKKLNRVSWASGVELCQVRLFLSEDCPAKVGVKSQDNLQAKTSWIPHLNYVESDARPSSFEGRYYVNPLKEKLSHIPQIKWQCPPEYPLNCNWLVAAGEESKEAHAQKHREMRVLEAIYPRHSDIPPSPSVALDVEECNHDDSHVPPIPITPIEEDATADMPLDIAAPLNASINSQSLALAQPMLISGNPSALQCNLPASLNPSANEKPVFEMLPGLQGEVAAAAAAALAALLKTNEQGSMIDTDLLIKFLSDPKMIEKLINENKPPAKTETLPIYAPKPLTSSAPLVSSKADLVTNTGTASISGSMPVTSSVPLPSSNPDVVMIKRTMDEYGPPNVVIKKLINEQGAAANRGTVSISGSKPVTSLVPLHSSKPDVEMIKKMIDEYGPHDNRGNKPVSGSMSLAPVVPLSLPKHDMGNLPGPNMHQVPAGLPMKPVSPDAAPVPSFATMSSPPVKDVNYYKNLIKQHGERQETQDYSLPQFRKPWNPLQDPELVLNFKSTEPKPKNQKRCIYFNSSKGCRNGSNCPYQHDLSHKLRPTGTMVEAPSAKKMKFGWEITGRT